MKLILNRTFLISDEFRSKTACENEVIQLVCNPFSRIAIYSASYGRTEYESIQCTQPQGVKEESKYLEESYNVTYTHRSITVRINALIWMGP